MTLPSTESLHQRGCELMTQGDSTGAKVHFLAVLSREPAYLPAMVNLGVIASNENNLLTAKAYFEKTLKMTPNDPSQWMNLGNVLMRLDRTKEAENALRRTVEMAPDSVPGWYNLALLLYRMRRFDEGLDCIDRLEALGHSTKRVLEDRAHFLLGKGDLKKGLELYENRWYQLLHLEPWDFRIPEWKGEDLADSHIMVHHEQGFGDTLMVLRFIPILAKRAKFVTLCIPPGLILLCEAQEWERVRVISSDNMTRDLVAEVDFQSPLWSMVRHMEVESGEIDPRAFLTAPKITTPNTVDPRMINVGICWASGKRNTVLDQRRRVSNLEDWLVLSEISPHIQLHNLWKDGEAQADIDRLDVSGLVRNCVDDLHNFADTAAFVSKLDFVITVDTAIVHLAGALGKPTIMLSQHSPCWRWWDIKNGTAKPWYETVEIVLQTNPPSWTEPLEMAQQKLITWLESQKTDSRKAA